MGILLLRYQSFLAADVVHFNQQQARFNARHVERQHAGGMNIKALARVHERVPDLHGIAAVVHRNPNFITQIARVSRA